MSFAYMPLYTGDYIRDTADLSPREHGAYLLMLMWCWHRAKPLPNDTARIYRICHVNGPDDEQAVDHVLSEFFVLGNDNCYHNGRLERELERCNTLTARGKAGARARWTNAKRMPNGCQRDAKPMLDGCQTDAKDMVSIPIPITISNTKENPLVGLAPDVASRSAKKGEGRAIARRVLDVLNRNAGRRYGDQDANLNLILARLREGYTERELCAIAAVKASQWGTDERMRLYLRPKTLFNATNAAQYRAELPANQIENDDA